MNDDNEKRDGVTGWLDEHRNLMGCLFICAGIFGIIMEIKTSSYYKVSFFQIFLIIVCFVYAFKCFFSSGKIKWF